MIGAENNETIAMLTGLSTIEVSGVKRAANRKRFAITKSETNVKDTIKAVLGTPAEGEEQYIATLKSAGADEQRIEAATAAYRLQKGFADVLKPEDFGLAAKAHKEPDGDEQGEDESDAAYKARKARKSAGQTGIKPDFTPAHKSADTSAPDPVVAGQLEAVMKSNRALAEQVQQLVDKNETLELVTKAEREFSHVPGSPIEIAMILKAARDAGPETEKQILAILKSTNEVVGKSGMLQELGTSGGGGNAGGAYARIEALASQLTMKADSGKEMTQAQKISYVTSNTAEGRALYQQYLEEKRDLVRRTA